MIWIAYVAFGVMFVYLAHRFVEKKMPIDGCDCKECSAKDKQ